MINNSGINYSCSITYKYYFKLFLHKILHGKFKGHIAFTEFFCC